MKKIPVVLLFCLGIRIVSAQVKDVPVVVDITPLKTNQMWAAGAGKTDIIKPDKDGKYVFHFTGNFPMDVRMGIDSPKKGQLFLLLEAGNNLQVKTDFAEKTAFSGNGAENARVQYQYMSAFLDAYGKLDAKMVPMHEFYKKADSVFQLPIDMLEANKQKVTPAFYTYQTVTLRYQKLGNKMILPYYYHLGFNKKMSDVLPENFWHLDDSVQIDDQLLDNPNYVSFMIGNYPMWLTYRELYNQGRLDSSYTREETSLLRYRTVEKTYTGKMRAMAMNSWMKSILVSAKDVKAYKSLLDQYVAQCANPSDAKDVVAEYEKLSSLAAGQVPPPFTLKDINGKEVALKDYAGKVVYMDFWASWCSPCRWEMKNGSPKLHEQFKDNKDVVFLYISIDDSEEKWRKAIAQDKINGIHLLSSGGTNSQVAKAFGINGIPHYIIIGKDGKIFDNNATRPSEDVTPGKINEALRKS